MLYETISNWLHVSHSMTPVMKRYRWLTKKKSIKHVMEDTRMA